MHTDIQPNFNFSPRHYSVNFEDRVLACFSNLAEARKYRDLLIEPMPMYKIAAVEIFDWWAYEFVHDAPLNELF